MKKIFSIALVVCALVLTSCVKDEVYPYSTVSGLTNTDAVMGSDVTVQAKVTALVNISSVKLVYTVDGGAAQTVDMKVSNGSTYAGVIPAQKKGAKVSYYVQATTESGQVTTSATNTFEMGKAPINYTGLVLNELNGNDKFIELYNGGDHDIYMGEITMYKDGGADATWTGPEKTIKKGEYLVLYSVDVKSTVTVDESLYFNSGLSAKKSVQITIKGGDGAVIDDFNLNNDAGTKYAGSFGRNADGKWYHQTTKTPGEKNVDGEEALTMK